MGLKKGIEFLYNGTTRLKFDEEGKIKEHRDYFDFCSGTFGNIPIIVSFFRCYKLILLTNIIIIYTNRLKEANHFLSLKNL